MAVLDVYFFALHEPYQSPRHPVAINATIVHALTLLHPDVPQPAGGLIYRCLTEFPVRRPGIVVPLSTLTYELNGGAGWSYIGDWEAVVNAVVRLSRSGRCDAMPLGLPGMAAALLGQGPTTQHVVHAADASPRAVGPAQRQQELDYLTDMVRQFAAQGPFWPGDNLVPPPLQPVTALYRPWS